MFKASSKYIFITLVLLLCCKINLAQETANKSFASQFEPGRYYLLTSIYGTTYRGPVIEENDDDFTILDKKTNTKHKLQKNEIKEVTMISASKAFQTSRFDDDYYTNCYITSENALPFKKQAFNSTTHYLFLSNMNYSFNEHWAVSMNVLAFFPISIGVKCSFKISEDIHFGANAFGFMLPDSSFKKLYCPFFGGGAKVTKGNSISNFSIGGGVIAINNRFDSRNGTLKQNLFSPLYYLSFAYANRFSKHFAFNIENYLFPQTIAYHQGTININFTGVSLKWIKNNYSHWNLGCYGLYIGSFSNLNRHSKIAPIPYIGYSVFFN